MKITFADSWSDVGGPCDIDLWVRSEDQWFCLISWRLLDVWISNFGIMSQYDPMFDLKINVHVGHCYLISWSSDFAFLMYEHHRDVLLLHFRKILRTESRKMRTSNLQISHEILNMKTITWNCCHLFTLIFGHVECHKFKSTRRQTTRERYRINNGVKILYL